MVERFNRSVSTFRIHHTSGYSSLTTRDVQAWYYANEDGFFTFKDTEHAVVYAIKMSEVEQIECLGAIDGTRPVPNKFGLAVAGIPMGRLAEDGRGEPMPDEVVERG